MLLHEPWHQNPPLPQRRLARDRDGRETGSCAHVARRDSDGRRERRWRRHGRRRRRVDEGVRGEEGDNGLGPYFARVGGEGGDGRAASDLAVEGEVGEVPQVGSVLDRRCDILADEALLH